MQISLLKHGLLASVAVFAAAVASPVAYALPAAAQEVTTQQRTAPQQAPAEATEAREAGAAKATEAQLQACQKRQDAIKNIMNRVADRGTKQVAVFNTISERTQAFYTEKGNTAADYDALVAGVATKKAAAEAALETTKTSGSEFSCETGDARANATALKDSLLAQNTALKEYKLAIKDLIVAVKTAQGTADSATTEGN